MLLHFLHRYESSLSGNYNGYVTCLPLTGNRLGKYIATYYTHICSILKSHPGWCEAPMAHA